MQDNQGYDNRGQYEQVSSKNPDFMQWFLMVEHQIDDLIHQWKGYKKGMDGKWKPDEDTKNRRVMNEDGTNWCHNFLKSFLGRANMASNYNDEFINFVMREYVSKPIFQGLEAHYWDFQFRRGVDLEIVGVQMCNLCLSILLGARANGFRDLITKTHNVQEIKQSGQEERRGVFSAIGSLFKRPQNPQEAYYMGGQ